MNKEKLCSGVNKRGKTSARRGKANKQVRSKEAWRRKRRARRRVNTHVLPLGSAHTSVGEERMFRSNLWVTLSSSPLDLPAVSETLIQKI